MLSLKTHETVESSIAPGLSYHCRILTKAARMALELELLGPRRKLRAAMAQQEELRGTLPEPWRKALPATATDEEKAKLLADRAACAGEIKRETLEGISDLDSEIERHLVEVKLLTIKAVVTEAKGVTVDGVAADLPGARFADVATDDLIEEAFTVCEGCTRLSESIAKNSQSPSTLAAVEGGESPSSTAAPASV